jgi:rRNA processing protein Gar1
LLFRVGSDIPLKALGARVVDTTMTRTVGSVYDIFGPVDNPFLSVKLQEAGDSKNTDKLSMSYFALLEQRRPGGKKTHDNRNFNRSAKPRRG